MSGTLGMVVPEISKNLQEMCLVFVYVFTPLSEISQFPAKLIKSRKTTQIEQNPDPEIYLRKTPKPSGNPTPRKPKIRSRANQMSYMLPTNLVFFRRDFSRAHDGIFA
jgi:hypothetical protein